MTKDITPDEFYNLTDDEIAHLSTEQIEKLAAQDTSTDESQEADTDEALAEEGNQADGDEEVSDKEETDTEEQEDGSEDISNEVKEPEQSKATKEKPAKVADEPKPNESQQESIDYKSVYQRIFAPFKANGREISVDTVDDVIALMQMGANYNKKMASLKPSLKVLKLLENNDLLHEEKLSFLIDLEKRNPEAIKKLIKDSGIDPLDVDVNKESDYKPTSYVVSDKQLELDSVLEEIQDTPTFGKVLSIATEIWDSKSKREIAADPQLLKTLNVHMANGIYDLISKEVDKERTFGRLSGLTDLEAYKAVGDSIHARDGFRHLVSSQAKPNTAPAKNTVTSTNKASNTVRNEKRKAASPTSAAPKATTEPDINPLSMSDEDFEKLVKKKYI